MLSQEQKGNMATINSILKVREDKRRDSFQGIEHISPWEEESICTLRWPGVPEPIYLTCVSFDTSLPSMKCLTGREDRRHAAIQAGKSC